MKTILTAFVPVLHSGYLKLFKKYPDSLFLITAKFFPEFFHLERDIRALPPVEMKNVIGALGIFKRIEVLNEKKARALASERARFVFPDEDVSRAFAEEYMKGKNVVYEPIFLRWNKKISDIEYEVPPDRIISKNSFDRTIIKKAEKVAEKSFDWWRQIAATVVKDGKILYEAYNKHLPTDFHLASFGDPRSSFNAGERPDIYTSIHAEASIIAQAAKEGKSLDGATLYTTTFPCPVCARIIAEAGIKKVCYSKGYSLRDAEEIFRSRNVEIILVK